MKKYFLTLFLAGCSTFLFAQKVKIENNIENIGDGYNMAFKMTIPYTNIKSASKKWTTFLKDNHAKVKTSKGSINAQYMVINGMSSDSMTVFSRITESDDACLLVAAFQKKGTFIGPATSPSENEMITKLLSEIGKNLSTEAITVRSEEASKVLSSKVKEQTNLTSQTEKLNSENVKMKKAIADNEKIIANDTERLEDLKKEISAQQTLIETIKAKTKDLE